MNKLDRLCEAICFHEGWRPGSRSYRNCNPGNLRWSKFEDSHEGDWSTGDRYSIFRSIGAGFTALRYDLMCKATGKTSAWHDADKDGVKDQGEGLTPDDTLSELFKVYAPEEDQNDPTSYAIQACRRSCLNTTDALSSLMEGE